MVLQLTGRPTFCQSSGLINWLLRQRARKWATTAQCPTSHPVELVGVILAGKLCVYWSQSFILGLVKIHQVKVEPPEIIGTPSGIIDKTEYFAVANGREVKVEIQALVPDGHGPWIFHKDLWLANLLLTSESWMSFFLSMPPIPYSFRFVQKKPATLWAKPRHADTSGPRRSRATWRCKVGTPAMDWIFKLGIQKKCIFKII